MIDVQNLSKSFRKSLKSNGTVEHFQALADVSFTINEGEILGIVGLSGSGKNNTSAVSFAAYPSG